MTEYTAERTAVSKASVFSGLGYPMHREEESSSETGWMGAGRQDLKFVSRETSGEDD